MTKVKVGVAILSRYNSSRLPGKALKKINGKVVLQYIYERVSEVINHEHIVIATSIESTDDPIADFCKEHKWKCFRGSLNNVAERFYEAGQYLEADYLIRINGDNLFLDINLLKQMIKITESNEYDFISNVKNRTFPKGMSVEIVRMSHYKRLLNTIYTNQAYQEHVTLYLYENELSSYHFVYNDVNREIAGIQLALDTEEDFKKAQYIMDSFERNHTFYNMSDVYQILKHKELL